MGPRTSRHIVLHFVWTISIALILFPVNSRPFQVVVLFNAIFATLMAASRHEPFSARKITLWDEAIALVGVFALGDLLY